MEGPVTDNNNNKKGDSDEMRALAADLEQFTAEVSERRGKHLMDTAERPPTGDLGFDDSFLPPAHLLVRTAGGLVGYDESVLPEYRFYPDTGKFLIERPTGNHGLTVGEALILACGTIDPNIMPQKMMLCNARNKKRWQEDWVIPFLRGQLTELLLEARDSTVPEDDTYFSDEARVHEYNNMPRGDDELRRAQLFDRENTSKEAQEIMLQEINSGKRMDAFMRKFDGLKMSVDELRAGESKRPVEWTTPDGKPIPMLRMENTALLNPPVETKEENHYAKLVPTATQNSNNNNNNNDEKDDGPPPLVEVEPPLVKPLADPFKPAGDSTRGFLIPGPGPVNIHKKYNIPPMKVSCSPNTYVGRNVYEDDFNEYMKRERRRTVEARDARERAVEMYRLAGLLVESPDEKFKNLKTDASRSQPPPLVDDSQQPVSPDLAETKRQLENRKAMLAFERGESTSDPVVIEMRDQVEALKVKLSKCKLCDKPEHPISDHNDDDIYKKQVFFTEPLLGYMSSSGDKGPVMHLRWGNLVSSIADDIRRSEIHTRRFRSWVVVVFQRSSDPIWQKQLARTGYTLSPAWVATFEMVPLEDHLRVLGAVMNELMNRYVGVKLIGSTHTSKNYVLLRVDWTPVPPHSSGESQSEEEEDQNDGWGGDDDERRRITA